MAEKNENFPNGLEAVVLVAALMLAEYLVAGAFYDMRGFLSMSPGDLDGMIMVLGNGIVFTVVMHYKGLNYRDLFHPSSSSKRATLLILLPPIALTIPVLLLTATTLSGLMAWLFPLSKGEEAMFAQWDSGNFANFLTVCVLAPVLEEMLFRGIILRSFLRQYSRWSAIIGSAALFGCAHMNLYQYVVAVIVGIFLGWLYERTKSLLPCIALHAAYNSACMMLAFNSANIAGDDLGMSLSFLWPMALLLGAAGLFMLRRVLLLPAKR